MAQKMILKNISSGAMCRPDTTSWYDQALTRTGG